MNAEPEKPTAAVQTTDGFGFITAFKVKAQIIYLTVQQSRNSGLNSSISYDKMTDHSTMTGVVGSGVKTDIKAGTGKDKD